MSRRIIRIIVYALVATALCQIGMAVTCINPDSVMHMPTIKNTAIVFIISLSAAIGAEIFFDIIICYNRKWAAWITVLAVFLLAVVIRSLLTPMISSKGDVAYRYPMLAAIAFGVLCCELISRKEIPSLKNAIAIPDFSKPETVYLVMILVLGTVFSCLLPGHTMTGVDDDMHYRYTLFLSEGIYTPFDENDTDLMYSWDESKGTQQHTGDIFVESDAMAISPGRVGYLGPTTGVWFGRLFGMSIQAQYFCARMGGLLIYAVIIYYAIKKLVNGKHLLGIMALTPIGMQYAVGLSYDAWLFIFTALGFAYFFGEIQRPDEKITMRSSVIMIGALFIGTWVKMPYAVMMLILLFIPKEKFSNSRQYRLFLLAVIGCIVFEFVYTMASSFGLGEVADYRGGEDVSGIGQMAYIKSNLIPFTCTMFKSALALASPASTSYLSYLYFYGSTNAYVIILIAMVAAAAVDNEITQHYVGIRIIGLVVLMSLLLVIVAAMYISFTPVGNDVVYGVQPRYTFQLLLPCFMLIFSGWYANKKINKQLINCLFYVVSGGCLIYNMVVVL